MSKVSRPPGKAMYVASTADRQWLWSEQRKLYLRSWEKSDYVFEKLWGLVCDPRNLRCALARVASNRGRNSPGVDKVTVKGIVARGVVEFLLRQQTGVWIESAGGTDVQQGLRRVGPHPWG